MSQEREYLCWTLKDEQALSRQRRREEYSRQRKLYVNSKKAWQWGTRGRATAEVWVRGVVMQAPPPISDSGSPLCTGAQWGWAREGFQQLPEAHVWAEPPQLGPGPPSLPGRTAGIQLHSFLPQNAQYASSVSALALLVRESRHGSYAHGALSLEGVGAGRDRRLLDHHINSCLTDK